MDWGDLIHRGDQAAAMAGLDLVISGQSEGYIAEQRWIHKSGRAIDIALSVKCLRKEDRTVNYFVALLEDVTVRKRTAGALAKSRLDLERRVTERTAQLAAANEELRGEIAGRKQTEEKLRRSEAHLIAAEQDSHVGSWVLQVATGKFFWSAGLYRSAGLTQ